MYYIICLYMFRAVVCSSSGGPHCILHHLVCHSLWAAVQFTSWERTAVRSQLVHCWRWAYYCSKHVEASNVIHILQNKASVHQVGNKNKFNATKLWHIRKVRHHSWFKNLNRIYRIGSSTFDVPWLNSSIKWSFY
jgi:hypothetical protein